MSARSAKAAQRKAIREAVKVLALCDPNGERTRITAPEDEAVLALCRQHGFGAVMDSASRQWRRQEPSGAFAAGPCVGSVQRVLAQLRAALRARTS